jgi:hypothetical protein
MKRKGPLRFLEKKVTTIFYNSIIFLSDGERFVSNHVKAQIYHSWLI